MVIVIRVLTLNPMLHEERQREVDRQRRLHDNRKQDKERFGDFLFATGESILRAQAEQLTQEEERKRHAAAVTIEVRSEGRVHGNVRIQRHE